jgi:hypothetical protein
MSWAKDYILVSLENEAPREFSRKVGTRKDRVSLYEGRDRDPDQNGQNDGPTQSQHANGPKKHSRWVKGKA